MPSILPFKLFVLAVSLTIVSAVDPVVPLGYSNYQGVPLENGITQWLGIRFAAPPVGDLRFAAPVDPVQNDTLQLADEQGKICLKTPGNKVVNATTTSEDCLFLAVYAPTAATIDSNLPVYFFIQGGGFSQDSNPNYNASGLIEASGFNIIVITFNYRVGPYGFLSGQEVQEKASLNNGLKDQIKALQWVQQYISLFGGNSSHVVIGGDSAGAASVTLLLTAYGGRDDGLFIASSAESQSFATVFNVAESQYQYDALVQRANCTYSADTLACLRGLSTSELQSININIPSPGASAAPLYMYSPVLDGDLIQDYTYSAYAKGNFIHLPAIYGDDTNEGTIFVPENTSSIEDTNTFLQNQWPSFTPEQLATIDALYPNPNLTFPNSGPYWREASNAYGEIRYICPGIFCSAMYTSSNLLSSAYRPRGSKHTPHLPPDSKSTSKAPVWNYHYNVLDPTDAAEGYGVRHTVELNAIFGPQYVGGEAPASYNTTNYWVVPIIQSYWTSFIMYRDPNTRRLEGSPVWEEFKWVDEKRKGGKRRLRFGSEEGGVGMEMETIPKDQLERCEYLWGIGVSLRQ